MFNTLYDPYQNGKKKRLFRHVKSLRKGYCSLGTLHKDGNNYTDNQTKSEILNEQFSSVFTRDDSSELPYMEDSPYQDIPSINFDILPRYSAILIPPSPQVLTESSPSY